MDALPGHMDLKPFWDLMEWERRGESLHDALLGLPPEDMLGFSLRCFERVKAAYRKDLWEAADLINAGCSDDGFFYFRCWLVDQGKQVYDAALENPDSLADVVEPGEEYECDHLGDAAMAAWLERTGRTDKEFYAELDRLSLKHPDLRRASWDVDDPEEFRKRFPRLTALYREEEQP
jgi:hypothetical protein